MTAAHQLLPVLTVGDAISGAARETRQILRDLGFESEIYAGLTDHLVHDEARAASRLQSDIRDGDVVLYHLSLGSPLTDMWKRLKAPRLIVYHNITPAHYFQDVSARVTFDLQTGREKLIDAVESADLCIANSSYNLSELIRLGMNSGVVIPPPVNLSRLTPQPATTPDAPTLLFVGRLAPNKRHATLLLILKALRETTHANAQLVLVGGKIDTEPYVAALRFQAAELGIADAVSILDDRISDRQLRDCYTNSSVLVCASEHEGFCMPLLEAMAFSVPVVALDAGAVGETVGNGGVLLKTRDPLVWAGVVSRILDDEKLRAQLVAAGNRRLADFDTSNIKERLKAALAGIGVEAPK